ncbi:DUF4339 domain-containing protein, partial [Isoptericola sp. NPDC056605]|uniref:DUF4339 domain-containing protein n=1 Tax=Isoptericola sp. NPDC056605 TaxID=3345876 RepID=UPI00368288E3
PAPPAAAAPPPAGPPPLPVAESPWFWSAAGSQAGPGTAADLAALVGTGDLTRETLVWQQGMAAWTPAGQVPVLAPLLAATPPPLPPQAGPSSGTGGRP